MSIMRALFLVAIAASAVFASPIRARATEGVKFGYEGNSGPNFWPDQCQNTDPGQSPIDIREGSADKQTGALTADLVAQKNAAIVAEGIELLVKFDEAGKKPSFVPQGRTDNFEIGAFHFHSPSEHHVNGQYFDAEMHMVGKAADGTISVLSVLMEMSDSPQPDNILSTVVKNLPAGSIADLDFTSVLQGTNQLTGFHTYTGSLTTPPCTTGVLWNVMDTVVPISVADGIALRKQIGFTARFTQVARDEQPVFSPPKEAAEGTAAELKTESTGTKTESTGTKAESTRTKTELTETKTESETKTELTGTKADPAKEKEQ